MKRNGMTIIELVVAFALTSVIALFLVQVVVFLKDTYVVNAVRSEIVLKQSTVSNMINELLDDNSIKSIDQNCGDNCVLVTFDDSTTQEINFDVEGNRIIVGDYVSKLPSTSKIDNVDVRKQFFLDENGETSYVFSISADVTSELFNDEIFKISAVYQSVFADKEDDSTEIPGGGGDEPIETTYEITYDCNGGSGSTAKSTHIYGVASNLSTNECSKITTGTGTGTSASPNVYYLVGWSTSSTATTATYADGQSVTDVAESGTVTLYAVWDKLFTYSNRYQVIDDSNGNWRVKFLQSGTCKTNSSANIDIFLVGGGGAGSSGYGAGGGGGYTKTVKNYSISATSYTVTVGAGGVGVSQTTYVGANGGSSAFGTNTVSGGYGGGNEGRGIGGDGGSGGGSAGEDKTGGSGGAYGKDGQRVSYNADGNGQGTTTCEFGQGTTSGCNSGVTAYSGGGGGRPDGAGGSGGGGKGASEFTSNAGSGQENTGGGGGGSDGGSMAGSGGSGIVIIRNAR